MAAKATAAVTVVMATMLVEAVTAVIKIRGIRRNESFCDAFCRSWAFPLANFGRYGVRNTSRRVIASFP